MSHLPINEFLQTEISKVLNKCKSINGYILLVDVNGSIELPLMKIIDFSIKDQVKQGLRGALVNTNFKLEESIYSQIILNNKMYVLDEDTVKNYPEYLQNLFNFWGEKYFIFFPIYSEKKKNTSYICLITSNQTDLKKLRNLFLKIEAQFYHFVRSYCLEEKEKSLRELQDSLNVSSNLLELIHDVLNLEKNRHLGIYKKILSFYLEYYKFDLGQIKLIGRYFQEEALHIFCQNQQANQQDDEVVR